MMITNNVALIIRCAIKRTSSYFQLTLFLYLNFLRGNVHM